MGNSFNLGETAGRSAQAGAQRLTKIPKQFFPRNDMCYTLREVSAGFWNYRTFMVIDRHHAMWILSTVSAGDLTRVY
jgi:hypothetical protein